MKIDLRKDRGILQSVKFLSDESSHSEMSEDELIAETMRRRREAKNAESAQAEPKQTAEPPVETQSSKKKTKKKKDIGNRNPLREILLVILMLSALAYYMNENEMLLPAFQTAEEFVYDLLGIDMVLPEAEDDLEQYEKYFSGDTLVIDTLANSDVLPDEVFNELMPVTPDIAALADSIQSVSSDSSALADTSEVAKPESLRIQLPGGRDTVIVYQEFTHVATDVVVDLSDKDIDIINNRSLLLMITELISNYPVEFGNGHIFLKRDALTIEAPRGGEWVNAVHSTLDKFVLGSFDEDYSSGTAKIVSKFEIIMNAEKDFQGQSFDVMRLLDILANPFADYLDEILIDPAKGTDDNPVTMTFSGNPQQIQYILSSWSESRSNYLVRSIDIDFRGDEIILKFGAVFFNYSP